jgi:isoleucyl-tRNA synthetase
MSPLNVHANWYPVDGVVKKVTHDNGKFHRAFLPKASTDNERSMVVIETPDGKEVMVRQIAGAMARRIVTYAKPGDESFIDEELDKGMEYLLELVFLGRAARNKANIKNRQPLGKMFVKSEGKTISKELLAILADELNVKEVESVEEDDGFVGYSLKPQLKTLGPKYGALLGGIREFLSSCDATAVVKAVEKGVFTTEIKGQTVEFTKDDLLISTENKSGFVAESANSVTVILDTNLTEELIAEGIVRELVSKLQTMRKEAGFDVTDHIKVGYEASGKVAEILSGEWAKDIAGDVLAEEIKSGNSGYVKAWDINGESVTLSVEKI